MRNLRIDNVQGLKSRVANILVRLMTVGVRRHFLTGAFVALTVAACASKYPPQEPIKDRYANLNQVVFKISVTDSNGSELQDGITALFEILQATLARRENGQTLYFDFQIDGEILSAFYEGVMSTYRSGFQYSLTGSRKWSDKIELFNYSGVVNPPSQVTLPFRESQSQAVARYAAAVEALGKLCSDALTIFPDAAVHLVKSEKQLVSKACLESLKDDVRESVISKVLSASNMPSALRARAIVLMDPRDFFFDEVLAAQHRELMLSPEPEVMLAACQLAAKQDIPRMYDTYPGHLNRVRFNFWLESHFMALGRAEMPARRWIIRNLFSDGVLYKLKDAGMIPERLRDLDQLAESLESGSDSEIGAILSKYSEWRVRTSKNTAQQ